VKRVVRLLPSSCLALKASIAMKPGLFFISSIQAGATDWSKGEWSDLRERNKATITRSTSATDKSFLNRKQSDIVGKLCIFGGSGGCTRVQSMLFWPRFRSCISLFFIFKIVVSNAPSRNDLAWCGEDLYLFRR
jgi:hypothetical protein